MQIYLFCRSALKQAGKLALHSPLKLSPNLKNLKPGKNKAFYATAATLASLAFQHAAAEPFIKNINQSANQVEIIVEDPEGFYVGAQPYLLSIGDTVLTKSYPPESGDPNVLIFPLSPEAFAKLDKNAITTMSYGKPKKEISNKQISATKRAAVSTATAQGSVQTLSDDNKAEFSQQKTQWSMKRIQDVN
ncbi:hypothetical protein [Agaribacterium haliotis]|uniref:hypothetical protein n=1 Tax=Agaribacterium haliotis TaxID=2013869 RepID=UPI000BB5560B|nr:hypothetical protein [Agaribacterium haliotis]